MTIAMAILALSLNVYSFFDPANANYMIWLALLFAGAMAFTGDRAFSIVVWIVCAGNTIFLNDGFRHYFAAAMAGRDFTHAGITAFCFALPLMCWVFVKPEPNSA